MTEARRGHGLGIAALTNVKHLIMTRSAKVRDICMVNTKKKQLISAIEPEVLEQNNSNSIKEQKNQYDMIQAKLDGAGDRIISDINNKKPSQEKINKTYRKFDSRLLDSKSNSLGGATAQRVKPNIYVSVPRGPARRHTDPLGHVKPKSKATETLQKAEPKERPKNIGGEKSARELELHFRPQTPKVKKSSEMRKKLKLLALNKETQPNNDELDVKTPTNIRHETQTPEEDKTVRRTPQTKTKRREYTRLHLSDQLLHPLWRRVPHRVLYGWSEQHELLETLLQNQIAEEELESIYYSEEEDYLAAQACSGVGFLAKPYVSSVKDVISLLCYYDEHPGALPKPRLVEKWREGENSGEEGDSEDVESGYDGDDE